MSNRSVSVVPVSTGKQRKTFLNLPWDHYKGDPNWIPPLRMNQKELVNFKKHPFYNTADIQTFLAYRDGKVCGRIAAIVDHAHNKTHHENRGMFGFFESINDQEVCNALLDACKEWLGAKGIKDIRGPMNPSMNYECGLLIDGFDSPPTFMMTYNPDYYQELLEAYGFEKAQDLFAFYGHVDMLESLDEKLKFVSGEAVKRFDLKVREIERKRFKEDVKAFLNIYNKSLPGQWGFVPLSDDELKHQAAGLKHLIVPEMTSIAEDKTGPVGVVFGLLDYNPLIREIDGRLFPFGFLKLLFKRKKITRVRMISTNVLPQYQMWGLGLVLMSRIIPHAVEWELRTPSFLGSWRRINCLAELWSVVERKSLRLTVFSTTNGNRKKLLFLVLWKPAADLAGSDSSSFS